MNTTNEILDIVSELKAQGEAFAVATVVRTISVTSAKAGAKAIIMGDGTVTDGWIGGGCARGAVLKAARDAIKDGVPRLVSVQPEDLLDDQGVEPGEIKDGVKYAKNMCPSEGSMDIFVEAVLPQPELVIMGASSVAVALCELGEVMGFSRTICADASHHEYFSNVDCFVDGFDIPASNASKFIVVSTQGSGDEAALTQALQTNAEYVAFVGSSKKAASLKEKLMSKGFSAETFERVKAPAGLDIKAITPEEIAVSIMAEVIIQRREIDRRNAIESQTSTKNNDGDGTDSSDGKIVRLDNEKMPQSALEPTSSLAGLF